MVGFLHEMTPSKNSLAYDLQEPFRFLVDLAVTSLVENEAIEVKTLSGLRIIISG
jgi:CRISPR-associated protein Cas1